MTVEIIQPEFELAAKLGPGKGIDPAVLQRAEQAIAAMAGEYVAWATRDVGRLQAAVASARGNPADPAALTPVREIAHEVRGQGGTFGYPLVTRLASSLYRLLVERPVLPLAAYATLDAHVDALRAVIAQGVKGDGGAVGQQLAGELEAMVARLVAEPA